MKHGMFRVARELATDVVHAANWTFGEWIGKTLCGYEFATPKNQWQRYARRRPPDRRIRLRTAGCAS